MIRYLLILLVTVAVTLSVSCKSNDDDSVSSSSTETTTTFTDANSLLVESSILSMPTSLQAQSSTNKIAVDPRLKPSLNGAGVAGIYEGITNYISFAEQMKEMVKELMGSIIKSPLLHTTNFGTKIIIPVDPNDPEAPHSIMVEKPTTGDYKWKVSLFFSAESLTPDMIIRFNIAGAGASGRLLWKMTEVDSELAAKGFDGIEITRTMDVTFDGTGTNKTLEIKFVQDLTSLFAYATTNWSGLTPTQQNNLDLGQPTKVFLNAASDGTTFTIYGTSYHEGWGQLAALGAEGGQFGDGRTMYMFKAKAVEGSAKGAKLYLALPHEDTVSTASVWTDDAVGTIFTNVMLAQFNDFLMPYLDDVDDAGLTGDPTAEQATGQAILNWLIVPNVTGTSVANAGGLTLTQFKNFIYGSTSSSGDAVKSGYLSVIYMVNPAFFGETDGFLGTLDETNDKFYKYTNGALAESADTSSIDGLTSLDLSSITPYSPAAVKAATITVE